MALDNQVVLEAGPGGQHLANLRRKGGLGKDPEREARRAQQPAAIDEDEAQEGWAVRVVVQDDDAEEFTDLTGAVTGRPPPANTLAIVQGEDRLLARVAVISRLTGGDAVIATKLGRNEARFLANVLGAT